MKNDLFMHDTDKPSFKFTLMNPGIFLSAFVLLGVVSCSVLQYQAEQHPLGNLEQASSVLFASLQEPVSLNRETSVFSPRLLESLSRAQPHQTLQTAAGESSFTHLYTTYLKRTAKHPPGALVYYQTPFTRLQVRWQVTTEWFSSVGVYGHFWRVDELCWENAELNALPCIFVPYS